MEDLSIYLLKSAGILAIFTLIYHFLLRKLTFFRANRWFLLFGMMASIVLPWIEITETVYRDSPAPIIATAQEMLLPPAVVETPSFEWNKLFLVLYVMISLFLLGKMLVELASLRRLLRSGTRRIEDGFIRISLPRKVTPFSFFNIICFDEREEGTPVGLLILKHEQVHAREWHSVDLLLTHLYCAIFWINPLAWWYKKQVGENLEFIADATAKVENTSGLSYERTLLSSAASHMQPVLANNFFTPFIKKRIQMLQQQTSKKWNAYKYALILPVLVLFLFSFNTVTVTQYVPISDAVMPVSQETTTADLSASPVIKTPTANRSKFTTPLTATAGKVTDTARTSIYFQFPATTKRESIEQSIDLLKTEYGVDLKLKSISYNKGIIVKIKLTLDDNQGARIDYKVSDNKGIDPVCIAGIKSDQDYKWSMGSCDETAQSSKIAVTTPIRFDVDSISFKKGTAFTIDSMRFSIPKSNKFTITLDSLGNATARLQAYAQQLQYKSAQLDAKMEQLRLLNNQKVDSALQGMKRDSTFKYFLNNSPSLTIKNKAGVRIKTRNNDTSKTPLYILNGEEITEQFFELIDPKEIESVSVLKDQSAMALYGTRASDGVIVITTKAPKVKLPATNADAFYSAGGKEPLFILDGKEITMEEMNNIDSNNIKSINVLKGDTARSKYGDKGVNGVVEIYLEKVNKNKKD